MPALLAVAILVTFPTADGGLIEGDLYGAGPRAVLLAHGGRRDKDSWKPQAEALTNAGFRVLSINLRGRGNSRGSPNPPPADDGHKLDVQSAIRYLRAHGAQSIFAIGGSMGGTAIAEAAAEAGPGEIERIVLLASGAIARPERMQGRKFFAICRDDPGPGDVLRLPAFRDQFERASGPKELLVLECSEHAQFIFPTANGARLLSEILRFLSQP